MTFKTFDGVPVEDIAEYIRSYVSEHPDARVFVGSDSQVRSTRIVFATVVCLYRPGKGAHILYSKSTQDRRNVNSLRQRLMLEVTDTMTLAFDLREKLGAGVALEVHFDISPDEKHKSNVAYGNAISYAKGSDFEVRTKPAAASFAASCVADKLC